MALLKSWFNPEAFKVMEGFHSGKESMLDGVVIAFTWYIFLENQQIFIKPTIILRLIQE
jgi:hypothetical protein